MTGLTMLAATPAAGQPTAGLFVLPGTVVPVPEPKPLVLSIVGGLIFLLISHQRVRD